jgi:hypothetical protein
MFIIPFDILRVKGQGYLAAFRVPKTHAGKYSTLFHKCLLQKLNPHFADVHKNAINYLIMAIV